MIFNFVLETAIIGSLVFIFIIALQKVLKHKITPVFLYYLWLVIFVKFLVPLDIKSSFSLERLIKGWKGQQEVVIETIEVFINNVSLAEQNTFNSNISWDIVWLVSVFIIACYYILKHLFIQKKINECKNICEKNTLELLENIKADLKIYRKIELIEADFVSSPAITGFWKVKILLPKNFYKKTSNNSMNLIFVHELMHLKYGDVVINLVLELIKILYFFNPLIYIISKKIKNDCELACDYRVLKYMGKNYCKSYGNVLIELASNTKENSRFEFGFKAMGNKRELERRIIMIGKSNKFGKKHILAGISTLILVSAVGLTSYADNGDINKNSNKEDNIIEEVEGANINNANKGEKVLDKKANVTIDTEAGEVLAIDSDKTQDKNASLNFSSGINLIVDEGTANISTQYVKTQIETMLRESGRDGKVENLVKNKNNFTYDLVKSDGSTTKEEVGIIIINSEK